MGLFEGAKRSDDAAPAMKEAAIAESPATTGRLFGTANEQSEEKESSLAAPSAQQTNGGTGKLRRFRDKEHLRFVSAQACTVCGRQPCEPHHIRFAQPRAMSRKVSDEFTVPLCRVHHREFHRRGDEAAWWAEFGIDPMPIALRLWQQTRGIGSGADGSRDGGTVAEASPQFFGELRSGCAYRGFRPMTSFASSKPIGATHCGARPRTEEGKRQSRANAFRHGLTAETVVARVEDVEDYKAFEAAVIADYDARTAGERELVLRLASLLWRLRRATSIETDF